MKKGVYTSYTQKGRLYFLYSSKGNIYGICAGGMNPGNNNDRVPVRDPLDLDRTYGNTCSFDTDCGVSNKCYKERGQIKGVCVKGR